ncbi:MAG: hypothetical protein NT088_02995 [Candidatus Omnitrophica bacterium]|nr:hypothetical protein [Candidatus Omnitrophota bacterium]
MSTYKRAIKEIIRFKSTFDALGNSRVARKLVGDIGEYYVLRELEKRGFSPDPKGGQAGYDIYLPNNDIRIEVRTSLLKNEGLFPKEVQFYGWRVKNRGQKTDDKFDFLVGIALDNSFKKPKFYIFTHKEAFKVRDVNIGRFRNIQKKIAIFENAKAMKEAIKAKSKEVTPYEKYINRNQGQFLNKWGKIKA